MGQNNFYVDKLLISKIVAKSAQIRHIVNKI